MSGEELDALIQKTLSFEFGKMPRDHVRELALQLCIYYKQTVELKLNATETSSTIVEEMSVRIERLTKVANDMANQVDRQFSLFVTVLASTVEMLKICGAGATLADSIAEQEPTHV